MAQWSGSVSGSALDTGAIVHARTSVQTARSVLWYRNRPDRPKPEPMPLGPGNHLLYGDNATVMRDMMGSQSVDLIYLDPPFKSDRNYNLIYSTITGKPVREQEIAFCDTWNVNTTKAELLEKLPRLMREAQVDQAYLQFWMTWVHALQDTQAHLLAYLYYMVERLLWMKPILKPTGSIYLHCDSTASHYIKVMMDGIFGHKNFRNEIIWKRANAHNDPKRYGRITDTILFYTAGAKYTWNPQYTPYREEYYDSHFKQDADGRWFRTVPLDAPKHGEGSPGLLYAWKGKMPARSRTWAVKIEIMERYEREGRLRYTRTGTPTLLQYADEMPGVPLQNIWTDIPPVNPQAKERLGYPTQKPIALLKRIVGASSNPGDVVFDPFCGCGTTVYAAQELQRRWIGCDIAILAIKLIRDILHERYRLVSGTDFKVSGIPLSVDAALDLFGRDSFQFQHWAVERVGGFPTVKRSNDHGVDGRIYYETEEGLRSMVLSVKGGKIKPADVRDLAGTIEATPDADLGGFISLQEPSVEMQRAATAAGQYTYRDVKYPKLQMLSIRQILDEGREFKSPTKIGSRHATGQSNLAFE